SSTFPVHGEPGAITRGGPLDRVARSTQASSEVLGGTNSTVRKRAVGIDPHVELQIVIAGEIFPNGRDVDRSHGTWGSHVRFKLHTAPGAAGGIRGRRDVIVGIVVIESHRRLRRRRGVHLPTGGGKRIEIIREQSLG